MAVFFECESEGKRYTIYAPEDKDENARILQHGLPKDIWFAIDATKYLPVYLRLPESSEHPELDELPREVVSSCCQLVKYLANTKKDGFVRYTQLANMNVNGPIDKDSTLTTAAKTKKTGPIASPELLATRKQRKVDFEAERAAYDERVAKQSSAHFRKNQKEMAEVSREHGRLAEQNRRGYTDLFKDESLMEQSSNQARAEDWEDDFM